MCIITSVTVRGGGGAKLYTIYLNNPPPPPPPPPPQPPPPPPPPRGGEQISTLYTSTLLLDRVSHNRKAIRTQANGKNAGTHVAQWIANLSYICIVNKGKTAPKIERMILLAANTETA
jgi:hypothetical protein